MALSADYSALSRYLGRFTSSPPVFPPDKSTIETAEPPLSFSDIGVYRFLVISLERDLPIASIKADLIRKRRRHDDPEVRHDEHEHTEAFPMGS
jgi:hypothetical protein